MVATVLRMRLHRTILLSASGLLLISLAGCKTVDPTVDYALARRMVGDRTGHKEVYSPDREADIDKTVEVLLADGLSTDEAVQIALLNNKRFQALFQDIGISRADLVQSGMLTNPSLGISARFPEGGGRSNLTLNFAQQIADLWQIPIRKRIAKAKLQRTILQVAEQGTNLAVDVKRDCYRVLALEQLEDVATETVQLAEKVVQLARDRFQAGEVGQTDINLARSNLLAVQARVMAFRRDRRVARTSLTHLLGLARWSTSWTLNDSLPHDPLPQEDGKTLLVLAMRERLDARAAAMKVHAAQDEVKRQHLRRFPNVTLGVELERQERRSLPNRNILADTARTSVAGGRLTAPSIQSRGQRNLERRQIIDSLLGPTLDITLPIWDQNQAKIAKARFQAVQARKDYEAILDDVARDLDEALAVATSASELVQFFEKESLPHARNNVEVSQRAYRAGTLNVLALLEAQKTLIAQREAYVAAQRDYAFALAELRRAMGGRLPSELDDDDDAVELENHEPGTE